MVEILLVEDSPADVVLAKRAFKEAEHDVHLNVVEDGREALNFLFKKSGYEDAPAVDLVLLDLNIPLVEGRDVLRAIKADKMLQKTPVIILSGSESRKDIEELYALQANCYLLKPVDMDSMKKIVQGIDYFWLSLARLSQYGRSY